MIKAIIGDRNNAVDVNSGKSLFATIYLSIIGPAVFIVQPGFVQGMVEFLGFSEPEAGYVASAEIWGIAITTLVLTYLANRIDWRKILVFSALLAVVGNFLSIYAGDVVSFAALRFIVGIGSGGLVSLTFTIIGLTANPDRNFGFMIMWILVYGAIGFLLMPIAYENVGMTGLLVFFGLFSLSALPFIRHLPGSGDDHIVVDEAAVHLSAGLKFLAIATMFVYFVAQGVAWAYLFLIGTNGGVSEQDVTYGLTASQFFGIAGALTIATISNRLGRITPLALMIIGSVISLTFLFGQMSAMLYLIAVCIFNYCWNAAHPILLATMASFDSSGRMVVNAVAAQMVGLAIGPALAASVIGENDYSMVIWLGIGLFALSLMLILPPLLRQRQLESYTTKNASQQT